jgi:hypothetical protein
MVEWRLAGESRKNLEKPLLQCHVVHHEYPTWSQPGLHEGIRGEKTVLTGFSCDTARNLTLFFSRGGGVKLSPLGTSATNWPIVLAPDYRRLWRIWRNENWQGKPKYSKKICPSDILFATNPTWPDLGSNPGRRGGKPGTNSLGYGTPARDLNIHCN